MPRARAPLDLGGNKLTSVANGTGSGDGAAFGQLPSASSPLATGSGGTGSATVAGAVYAAKPATTDAVCYVSKAASASDANDGLSLGSAKATLAAAVTALGAGPGVIRMGAGTWTITSPAAVNIPLAVEGIPGATVISTSTANTPVFAVTANNVTLTGLTLTGPQFAAFRSSEKAVTVLGSSASAPVTGFTMRDCVISNWGYGGLYLQYVSGFTVERCTVTNVLYAAVMVLSGAEGMIRGNLIDTVTGTGEPACYGIALTRNDAAGTTLTTDPRTTEVTVTGNRVRNVTTWEGIDTHGGTNLDITGNQVYGCYRGIAINNCPDATGAAAFAPHNVSVSGNIVDSTALGAGLADVGIVVQGAITTAGSPTECATGCTITGNTVTGCGLQGNNLSGAILGVATYGLQVTGNTIHQPSPFGVMLYHDNYGFTVSGNTVTDAWSSSYTLTSGVAVRSGWNTGHIGSNSYVRPGSLSATFLFVNGTYITSGITNSSVALGYGYCDPAIATPLSDVSAVSKPLPVASGGTGTATAAQNGVFAGPATGGTGAPSFRALATTDVPTLNQNTTGTAANLSGTPALPSGTTAATQTTGDSSTKIATDAFVATAVAGETTRAQAAETLLAPKASPALTGTPTAPTAAALTGTTQVATTAYADSAAGAEKTRALAAEALLAPLASPTLTGSPTAPTQTTGDATTKIATDQFVGTAVAALPATVSTWTADQYFKSGRPWFDAIAFGADPSGTADSTLAIQTAINTALRLRTDTGVSMSGFSVTDPAAVAGDVGKYVNSPNYPPVISYAVSVTATNPVLQVTGLASAPFVSGQPVIFTAVTAPSGFTAGGTYYVVSASYSAGTFSFGLSATSGGGAITPATTGTTVAVEAVTGGCSLITGFTSSPVGYTVATPVTGGPFASQVVAIGTGSSVTVRTALGPVWIPAGTYKITSDLLIQSAQGFGFVGAGGDCVTLVASGTGFTTAVLNVDGSYGGTFAGFNIIGNGTEGAGASGIPNAINLTWTTGAARSTSANTFRNIRIRNLKFVSGLTQAAPPATTRQVDGSTLSDIVITGGQTLGSWSSSGNWQQGFVFGNGAAGNQYDFVLTNCSAVSCYYGYYCSESGYELYGAQPAANYCEFYFNSPGAQVAVSGIQSQDSQMFLSATGGSSTVVASFRDIQFKGHKASAPPNSWWMFIGAGSACWEFSSVQASVGTAYTPVVRVAGTAGVVTFTNLQQAASISAGISLTSASTAVAINYVQLNTVNQVVQVWPVWISSNAQAVFSPLDYGAVGDGAANDTTALQNCAAAAAAVKGVIDLGARTFKATSPITITTGFHMRGTGYGGGTIVNSTSDMFTISGPVSLVTFENCNLTSNPGGGHIWNATSGPNMSLWKILGCQVTQNNAAKSIWVQVGGGWIDCLVDQWCNFQCVSGATVSPWSMTACAGAINSVTFRNLLVQAHGATVPFFRIDPGSTAGWNEEIAFRDVTWEVTTGGAIAMTACADVQIDNCALWDIPPRRADTGCSTTSGSATVGDTSAVSGDLGNAISGAGIPAGAQITAVTAGTGYTISANATATGSGLTLAIGGPAANQYSFTQSTAGYPCRNVQVRGGRANGSTTGAAFYDFFADSNATNILIDSFGSWGTPAVISSPAAQTTIINPTVASGSPTPTLPGISAYAIDPTFQGYKAWTADMASAYGFNPTTQYAAGFVYLGRLLVPSSTRAAGTINGYVSAGLVKTGTGAANWFLGIYGFDGTTFTLLGTTADLSSNASAFYRSSLGITSLGNYQDWFVGALVGTAAATASGWYTIGAQGGINGSYNSGPSGYTGTQRVYRANAGGNASLPSSIAASGCSNAGIYQIPLAGVD